MNGINHTPRGGKVEVVLEGSSHHEIVRILDSGCGMTQEELAHLFERFYQGHSDRHPKDWWQKNCCGVSNSDSGFALGAMLL